MRCETLDRLRRNGTRVELTPDELIAVSGERPLTDELRAAVKANREIVVAALKLEQAQ